MNFLHTFLKTFSIVLVWMIANCIQLSSQSDVEINDPTYSDYLNEELEIKERGDGLKYHIFKHYLFAKPDSAEILAKELYEFFLTHNEEEGILETIILIGTTHSLRSQYDKSEEYFNQALQICKEKMPSDKADPDYNIYNNIAATTYANIAYDKLDNGEVYSALNYFMQAIQLFESIEENPTTEGQRQVALMRLLNLNGNVLEILLNENELEKASEKKNEIDSILPKLDRSPRNSTLFDQYARFYRLQGEPEKAIVILKETIESSATDNSIGNNAALANSSLGDIYLELNELDSAKFYLKNAHALSKEIQNNPLLAKNLNLLGEIYLKENDLSRAKLLLSQAKDLALEKNIKTELSKAYLNLSIYHSKKENYAEAYSHHQSYVAVQDSLLIAQENKLLLSYEDKFQYESRIALQEQNLVFENRKFKNARNQLYGAGLLAFIFSLFSYFYYRINKKLKDFQQTLIDQKDTLLENNNKIEKQQGKMAILIDDLQKNEKIIEAQNFSLKESNNSLENFAYIAAHDLNAPIRTISSYVQLLHKRYNDKIEEKDKYMFDFIKTDSKRLFEMVNGLLGISQITKDLPAKQDIDLNDLISVVFKQLASDIKNQGIDVKRDIKSLPTINSYYPLLQQLFLNLISNSVKFSKDNQNTITIDWKENEDYIEFRVMDEGKGIPKSVLPTVFDMFSKHYDDNEDAESGNGIGLATCRRIVNFLGGEISVESTVDVGTTFVFTLKAKDNAVVLG